MSCNENGNIIMRLVENASGISKGYVDSAVKAEADARAAADEEVRAYAAGLTDGEAEARQAEIKQEADERKAADIAEETARKAADSAEQVARMEADAQLGGRVSTNANNISANAAAISAEATTRAGEDDRIEAVIDSHKQEADNRFGALSATIAQNLQAAKDYADSKAAGALHFRGTVATKDALPKNPVEGDFYTVIAEDYEEYAWNGSAWYAIGKSVDTTAINNRLSALETGAAAEAATRASADTALNSRVTAETTRATAEEARLEGLITTEAGARATGDEEIKGLVTAEATTRAAEDVALEGRINAQLSTKTTAQIAADFEQTKAKINAVADWTDTGGFWVFAITDSAGNVTFGQTINGDLINALEK